MFRSNLYVWTVFSCTDLQTAAVGLLNTDVVILEELAQGLQLPVPVLHDSQ